MIRKLTKRDLKQVNYLVRNLYNMHVKERKDIISPDNRKYTESEFNDLFNYNYNILLGAEVNKKLIGLCIGDIREYVRGYKVIFISELIVDENYRKQGIGKELLKYAKQEGKQKGAKRLELSVYNFNENAMEFYKSIGMTPLRTVMEEKIENNIS